MPERSVDLTSGGAADLVTDWDSLRHVVTANGDVSRVAMWLLRDLQDKGRLGVHVRTEISRRLAGLGLGHLPLELPSDQNDIIMVYKQGTPAAMVIEAIYQSGNSPRAEAALRKLNTAREAETLEALVEKVSEINAILDSRF
ncbi:hypothetical protein [Arthrobacter sp. MMS18-M83]|uniref:hypothetical protein n=1 Tax=Arthrobacter sp. MMS18-M83 TaxID=2996261 RepID=UPI00227A8AE0|nr:hypothetical protein [Arthrobacter sp. MMS18-M83]WAH98133.1 hypothetical protein OW521_04425 [Arthrobacter sp. MMS18-M83]